MATKTVKQKLDELFEKWYAHLLRPDLTAPETEAYRLALSFIEDARREAPNKALRSVQNRLILRWGSARDRRDFSEVGSMGRWEQQASMDAYRQLRADMDML